MFTRSAIVLYKLLATHPLIEKTRGASGRCLERLPSCRLKQFHEISGWIDEQHL
jgi:hypothetical protein